jgi:hypothetical protein
LLAIEPADTNGGTMAARDWSLSEVMLGAADRRAMYNAR